MSTDEQIDALSTLEGALCEFINAAADNYDPSMWIPETERNFKSLSDAYELAHIAGVFAPTAAEQAQEAQPVVKVKQLEWINGEARSSLGDLYEVVMLSQIVWTVHKNGTAFPSWVSSFEAAKAAAQADFEQRILSQIEYTTPTTPEGWQSIETCEPEHVLFYGIDGHGERRVFEGWKAVNGRFCSSDGRLANPTHWMPLPAAPKPEDGR